jgi:Flp pilus assembly protein TadD
VTPATAEAPERARAAPARATRALGASALALAALAAFFPVLSNGFVDFDDGLYVVDNPWVRAGLSWEGLRWAFAPPADGGTYWHPLTWLSLMADVQLFGPSAPAIHAVNLALHAAAAVLLFLALEEMTGWTAGSLLAALLWVVHPLQVEAVAWAVERKTVLAGALAFAATWAHARHAARPGAPRLAAVAALLALGMLAKPMVVTLPFLFLLLDAWPLGRTRLAPPERPGARWEPLPWRRLLLEKAPLLAVALILLAVAASTHPPPRDGEAGLGLRVANALTSTWAYLGKVAWPARLAVFYPQAPSIPPWRAALAAAGILAALGLLAWPRPRPPGLVGALWFLGCLVPMSGLLRGGLWPGMADRFVYLSLAGLLVGAIWTVADAARAAGARRWLLAGTLAAAAALAVRSNAYARAWRDSETLFRHAVASTGRAKVMRANLGRALAAQGRLAEARAVYEELARVAPDEPDGWVNLGSLAHRAGDLAAAEALYGRALQVAPRNGEALYDMGLVRTVQGRTDEALALFGRAVEAGFDRPEAHVQLGALHWAAGRLDEAEAAFRRGAERDARGWQAGYDLASLLFARGRAGEARALLLAARQRAVALGDDPAPLDEGLRRIGASGP